jgi:hypothetical protein
MKLSTCSRSLLIVALGLIALPASAAERPVNFARDVKPILAGKCFACHGPDASQRKAELRLDTSEGALENEVFTPGKAATSELIARVTSSDPKKQMPPPESKKPGLTAAEVEILRKWIDAGAKYEAHWAYVAPAKPAPPAITDSEWATWPRGPIDQFVVAAQLERGLHPADEADKRTLVRRLSLDLTGLPPSAADVEAFVADPSPQAYEKLVERLLASPAYGERMAMFWLDLVRFADTAGYHSDNERQISPYRDWVIQAFRDNKPFDQFTIEQLAGDLLPNATNDQKIASGYNRLLQTTEEGGAQAKEYTAKYVADRVRNASNVWMGATLGCAECHDHKFDPYTAKDFYSFGAFFADIQETAVGRQAQVSMPSGAQQKRMAALDEQVAALRTKLEAASPELDAAQAKWEAQAKTELAAATNAWQVMKPEAVVSTGKQTLTVQDDLSVLASGTNPPTDTYVITLPAEAAKLSGVRLEALTHESLGNKSLSRGNGNFVLTEVSVGFMGPNDPGEKPVKLKAAEADFSQDTYPIANAIDGKPNTGWAVAGHEKATNHVAAFTFAEPVVGAAGAKLTVRLVHGSQFPQHNIGRFRISVTSADKPSLTTPSGVPVDVATAIAIAADQRTPEQKAAIAKYYRTIAPETAETRNAIVALEQEKKAIADQTMTLISQAGPPRVLRILPRGNWLDETGEIVAPAVPAFLGKIEAAERATRLDLAKWLVSNDNPVVARVFVNRLWRLTFGHGVVRNMEDYGTQGSFPSHPELLDWLAIEFRESGWNVQHLLKLMVLSRTYQQTSVASAALRDQDPGNEWLTRQDRYRLDGEFVRDNALAISGLLSRKLGGPSVKPYQPDGYWQFLNFPARTYVHDKGESLYRRGMYTYWQRSFLNPSLLAFDVPSREECTNERPRSNTPLQALALLNDPTCVEAARAFAARIIKEGGADAGARIDFAFRQAVGRPATPGEVQVLTALANKHLAEYTADKAQAVEVLTNGDSKPPEGLDAAEVAAWTSVARVILNLHEVVTRS